MEQAPIPKNDEKRVKALHALNILDTDSEERFDRITRIAHKLLKVEISLLSLVDKDRQWFKSRVGLEAQETPRDISFCGHAIMSDEVFVVEDTLKDQRFHDNPLVTDNPNIRFYAGKPLVGPDHQNMGTFCIIDSKPRQFTSEEKIILEDLSKWVELELNNEGLSKSLESYKGKIKELEQMNKIMIDRELKMIELKSEIKKLKEKLSKYEAK